jgi:beta-galactosidase
VNGELEDLRFDTQIATRKRMVFENPSNQLDLLVENMGRVNFGKNLHDQAKGIRGPILLDGKIYHGFEVYPLPMDNIHEIDFASANQLTEGNPFKGATFSEFIFELGEPADCYLDLEGFTKGFAVLNGFNLGRYWRLGPQKRLYIPGPILKKGRNSLVVFESDGRTSSTVALCEQPLWSGKQ